MNQKRHQSRRPVCAPDSERSGSQGQDGRRSAFTLIEMMTVIAVIGLLAGMAVALAPRVGRANRESRIRAQLNQIATAIESYYGDFGHYPPDNLVPGPTPYVNAVTNSLFYELSGMVLNNRAGNFVSRDGSETVTPAVAQQFFHADGFVNAKEDPKDLRRPYLILQPNQSAAVSQAPLVKVLAVPVPWPLKRVDQPTPVKGLNPWHYVSTRPTNNATSFDLWAEWVEDGKVKILSNWSRDVRDRN